MVLFLLARRTAMSYIPVFSALLKYCAGKDAKMLLMNPPAHFLPAAPWASPGWRTPPARRSSRPADPPPAGSSWRRAQSCRSGGLLFYPGRSGTSGSSPICLWCQSVRSREDSKQGLKWLQTFKRGGFFYSVIYFSISPVLYAGCTVCWFLPPASCCTVLLLETSWLSPCSLSGTFPAGTLQPHLTNTQKCNSDFGWCLDCTFLHTQLKVFTDFTGRQVNYSDCTVCGVDMLASSSTCSLCFYLQIPGI